LCRDIVESIVSEYWLDVRLPLYRALDAEAVDDDGGGGDSGSDDDGVDDGAAAAGSGVGNKRKRIVIE
jgi:hypothetical protein